MGFTRSGMGYLTGQVIVALVVAIFLWRMMNQDQLEKSPPLTISPHFSTFFSYLKKEQMPEDQPPLAANRSLRIVPKD